MQRWREPIVRGALVLLEAIWAYALIAFFVAFIAPGGGPSFIGVGFIVGASFAISRLLQASDLSLGVLRVWGAALSLLLFYAVVRVDFYGSWAFWDFTWADHLVNNTDAALRVNESAVIGVPLMAGFWVRGVLRGQQSVVFEDVVGSFALGVLVIAGVALLGTFVDEMPGTAGLLAVPYIAVGLLTISLTQTARARDSVSRDFTPAWLMAVGGSVLALGLFALLFVLIDFSTARTALGYVAYGIGWVFAGIFFLLAFPIIKLLEAIFWAMQWIAELWGGTPVEPDTFEFGEAPEGEEPQERGNILPQWVQDAVRYAVAVAVMTGLGVGLAMLFTRYQRRRTPGELKESVYTEGRLGADLGGLLGSVLGRLRPRGVPRTSEPVRRLYFEMLAAGEARGVQRRPVETPLDFAPRLERTFASETPGAITGLFDDVRYGAKDAEPGDIARLREEWERVRSRS